MKQIIKQLLYAMYDADRSNTNGWMEKIEELFERYSEKTEGKIYTDEQFMMEFFNEFKKSKAFHDKNNLNTVDEDGNTFLMYAVVLFPNLVVPLLQSGVDVTLRNVKGNSAYDIAINNKKKEASEQIYKITNKRYRRM